MNTTMRHKSLERKYSDWNAMPTRIKPIKLTPEPSLAQRIYERYSDVILFSAGYSTLVITLVLLLK